MSLYDRHVFVCVNERPEGSSRGCCATGNAAKIRDLLKRAVFDSPLRGKVRINKAGCLDQCEQAVAIVVYPDSVWYGGVTIEDVDEIFREHLLHGRPVERLLLDPTRSSG